MQAAKYCTSSTKTTTTGKTGPQVNVRLQLHEPVEYGADKSNECIFAEKKWKKRLSVPVAGSGWLEPKCNMSPQEQIRRLLTTAKVYKGVIHLMLS